MKGRRWWRSAIARRALLVGACGFMVFATLTAQAGMADSFTGQFPWAGNWVTIVVLGTASLALGSFCFGVREDDAESSVPPAAGVVRRPDHGNKPHRSGELQESLHNSCP